MYLQRIMDTIGREKKQSVIMGDINVDFLKYSIHAKSADIVDTIHACGFLPVIDKPTRVCNSSKSLIDHIF